MDSDTSWLRGVSLGDTHLSTGSSLGFSVRGVIFSGQSPTAPTPDQILQVDQIFRDSPVTTIFVLPQNYPTGQNWADFFCPRIKNFCLISSGVAFFCPSLLGQKMVARFCPRIKNGC